MSKCFRGNCFNCIRSGTTLVWSYECHFDILSKLYKKTFNHQSKKMIVSNEIKSNEDYDFLIELVEEVMAESEELFQSMKTKLSKSDAEVIGDSIARLYLFLILRHRNLISKSRLINLLPVIRRASNKSIPAQSLKYMIEGGDLNMRLPQCWINMTMGRADKNDGNPKRTRIVRNING